MGLELMKRRKITLNQDQRRFKYGWIDKEDLKVLDNASELKS